MGFLLNIRQKIGNWQNELSKVVRQHSFSGPLSEKKDILIITEIFGDEDREAIEKLRAGFKEMCPQANVTAMMFYNKQKGGYNFISDGGKIYFSREDFSFFFKIKEEQIKTCLRKKYDIAFVYSKEDKVYVPYLSAYVMAGINIGVKDSDVDQKGYLTYLVGQKDTGQKDAVRQTLDSLKMVFSNTTK